MANKSSQANGKESTPNATPAALPPGYFLSLAVKNLRCFGDELQKLDLSDGNGRPAKWTILLGDNGSGKTTLLQAIAASQWVVDESRFHQHFPRGVRLYGLWRYVRRSFAEAHSEVKCTVISGSTLKEPRGESCEIVIKIRKANSIGFDGNASFSPRCYGYGASRRLSISTIAAQDHDDPTLSLFSDDAVLRNPEEWLLRLDYSAGKPSPVQAQQKLRLEKVKGLLLDLLPDVEDIRFVVPQTIDPNPSVEFKTPYGWILMRNLGHGYRTLIAWVVDFAARLIEEHPESEDPLAAPAVALIDEIDLHLHPVWQRKVMSHLTTCFPNTQFIATAHSPLIVQAAQEDTNLALLQREGDRVIIRNDLKAVKGWRIDQVLTSDLFGLQSARPPKYDELLAERKAIMTKPKLSKLDKKRLGQLDEQIGDLPAGDSEMLSKMERLLSEAKKLSGKEANGTDD